MEAMGYAICSFVGNQFSHHRNLEENLNKMKRKTEELNSRKDDVESAMKAEIQPGKKAKKEVELWFVNIQKVNEEIEAIETKVKKGIKNMERVSLGKQICSIIQKIEDLYQKGCFSDGLVIDDEEENEDESKRRKMGKEDVGQRVIFGMGGIGDTIFTNKNSTSTIKFEKVVIEEEECSNKSKSENKEEAKKKGKERKRKREAKANAKKVIFGVGGIGKTTMKNTDSNSTITFGDIQI